MDQRRRPLGRLPGHPDDHRRAAAAGWRIAEVDVDYLPRTGRSEVTGTLRDVGDMRRVMAELG
ncbi:hypothetical protein [Nonomuraea angiospora]